MRAFHDNMTKRKALLAASAAAMCVTGPLVSPSPASAAPQCGLYGFNGISLVTYTGDNWTTGLREFEVTADRFNGEPAPAQVVDSYDVNNTRISTGYVSGWIHGQDVHYDVAYGEKRRSFDGQVSDIPTPAGQIAARGPGWWSDGIECLSQQPAQVPVPQNSGNNATVVGEDVDVYNAKNEPDGTGHVVGILRVGKQVTLMGPCVPQDWCEVAGDFVPGGRGWVWGHLQLP